jgi:hypothetical protein
MRKLLLLKVGERNFFIRLRNAPSVASVLESGTALHWNLNLEYAISQIRLDLLWHRPGWQLEAAVELPSQVNGFEPARCGVVAGLTGMPSFRASSLADSG